MPFFPVDWSKNANNVYDSTKTESLPKKHVHQEVDQAEYPMWYDNLHRSPEREPSQLQVDGARPTSGKHYARTNDDANVDKKRYLGDLVDRSEGDPLLSNVAKNYSNTKKVQGLLDKLASYMGNDFDQEEFLMSGNLPTEKYQKASHKKKKETRNHKSLVLLPNSHSSLPIGNLTPIRE